MITQKLESLISHNSEIFKNELKKVVDTSFKMDHPKEYDESLKRITPSIEVVNQEVTFVALVGKGKKQKRIEVSSANNLFDSVSEINNIKGVQLAFAF